MTDQRGGTSAAVGGTDREQYAKAQASGRINELPVNHSPLFAPAVHPTLQTGVETLVVAAGAWIAPADLASL